MVGIPFVGAWAHFMRSCLVLSWLWTWVRNQSKHAWLATHTWFTFRPLIVASMLYREPILLAHYRVLFDVVLYMHHYCWVACQSGTNLHTVSQLKCVSFQKTSEYSFHRCHILCFFLWPLECRSRTLFRSKNSGIMVMAASQHKLQRKSLMRN